MAAAKSAAAVATEMDAAAVPQEFFQHIPLSAIVPSRTNPRTHFSEDYLAELAGSIRDKGLIQPIILRPRSGAAGAYEIVAGECRFRASAKAGLVTVPAIVRRYSDDQVLEVQLIENIHRTDLTPLEQAAGYRRLITANPTKHSAETIAARIGMSVGYVWDRLKLNDLVPEAKQLLETERITVGHAVLISRLKPEHQTRVLDPDGGGLFDREGASTLDYDDDAMDAAIESKDPYAGMKPRSLRELDRWIVDHVRFDVTHAAQAAPLEFEDVAAQVEAAAAKPGRGKKVIAITLSHFVQPDAREEGERTFGPRAWKYADGVARTDFYGKAIASKTCEFAVLGVVAAGQQYGEAFDVCIARDRCTTHWQKEMSEKEKNASLRAKGQTSKAAKNEAAAAARRQAEEEAEVRVRKEWIAALPDIKAACVGRMKTAPVKVLTGLLMVGGGYKAAVEYLGAPKTADALVRVLALGELLQACRNEYWAPREFPAVGKRIGVDIAAILKKHKSGTAAPAPAKGTKGK